MITALAAAIISLSVSAPVCSSPCTVKVTVRIENASERDRCEVTIDGENEFHASEIEVVSDRRTYETLLTVHNAGEYEIKAVLLRPVDHQYMDRKTLLVNGGDR